MRSGRGAAIERNQFRGKFHVRLSRKWHWRRNIFIEQHDHDVSRDHNDNDLRRADR
jgi:hypothetical protein